MLLVGSLGAPGELGVELVGCLPDFSLILLGNF
jgi:hypothetical protein